MVSILCVCFYAELVNNISGFFTETSNLVLSKLASDSRDEILSGTSAIVTGFLGAPIQVMMLLSFGLFIYS